MDKTAIKKFAMKARSDLIEQIKLKAQAIGITATNIQEKLPISTTEIEYYKVEKSDEQREVVGKDIVKRQKLVDELHQRAQKSDQETAFNDLVEEVAYTWFNRIIAIRFMEVNNYLPSRTRILSSSLNRKEPDIVVAAMTQPTDELGKVLKSQLNPAEQATVARARDTERPVDMDAMYRMLFIKQANALNENLPYLFEKTDDYAELLFTPSYNDGVIHHLITDISEDDFNVEVGGQVEIIGWLYQYYNTEPKDIAFKKRKYEESDIPAVTQLFTPDWIVKYLVENSLGHYWVRVLQAKGDQRTEKAIAESMGWQYLMSAAQQSQAIEITVNADQKNLKDINPEDVTLIDAAMGSGHILVYAFDVFMQIYGQEGYSRRDAANLIIKKNLYGLDIDTRAFQLAYFALMMKAREYDRRFLARDVRPHVYDIPDSQNLTVQDFQSILQTEQEQSDLAYLLDQFKYGNEYGSLITPENTLNWESLKDLSERKLPTGQLSLESLSLEENQRKLQNIVAAGHALSQKYTIGAMNPPYMGSGKMDGPLSKYVKKNYPNSKSDLFAVFMERLRTLTQENGYFAMITQHAWMFLSSFEKLRQSLKQDTLLNMAHMGTRAFEEIGGEVVQSTAFVYKKQLVPEFVGNYERLVDFNSQEKKEQAYLQAVQNTDVSYLYRTNQANFNKIPGMPIAYWASKNLFNDFVIGKSMGSIVQPRVGLQTGSNTNFIRFWYEVVHSKVKFNATSILDAKQSNKKWFPYNKGGSYRKWYGNYDYVVNWENDGQEIRNFTDNKGKVRSRPQNTDYYFHEAITWSLITSGAFSMRYRDPGSIHDVSGMSAFSHDFQTLKLVIGIMNSPVGNYISKILNPTINLQIGNLMAFPLIFSNSKYNVDTIVDDCIALSRLEWDLYEVSWNFKTNILLSVIADEKQNEVAGKLQNAFKIWQNEAQERFDQLKANEEELNRIFIDLYGLNDELTPEVADKDISVRLADEVRDIKSFLSYFVGVVFGRYSLDTLGLAFAGGQWDDQKYQSFKPNSDNVLMLNDADYFGDSRDIIHRLREFLSVTFGEATVDENLAYIAQVLGKKADSDEAAIRKYFVDDFFKDHNKIYQKRPIYWELSSGRNDGFKALMYLHRYDADELAMIRTDYLHPLQGKYEGRLAQLTELAANEPIVSQKKRYEKELKHLEKQLDEVKKYDAPIQHLANQKIQLDLDDGVVVNHQKLQGDEKILTKLK